jgi:hypothetical protein
MPRALGHRLQVLDGLRVPPPLILAGDNVGARIVAHSQITTAFGSTSTGGLWLTALLTRNRPDEERHRSDLYDNPS